MNLAAQKLSDWLKSQGIRRRDFAARIDVGAPMVSRLLNGARTPSMDLARRIHVETKGFVAPNDWVAIVTHEVA